VIIWMETLFMDDDDYLSNFAEDAGGQHDWGCSSIRASGWLHFEDDPVAATQFFASAGVADWVAQRLSTVYENCNGETAARLLDELAGQISTSTEVKATGGVPGLPTAR
jgi:hypothetical protein